MTVTEHWNLLKIKNTHLKFLHRWRFLSWTIAAFSVNSLMFLMWHQSINIHIEIVIDSLIHTDRTQTTKSWKLHLNSGQIEFFVRMRINTIGRMHNYYKHLTKKQYKWFIFSECINKHEVFSIKLNHANEKSSTIPVLFSAMSNNDCDNNLEKRGVFILFLFFSKYNFELV